LRDFEERIVIQLARFVKQTPVVSFRKSWKRAECLRQDFWVKIINQSGKCLRSLTFPIITGVYGDSHPQGGPIATLGQYVGTGSIAGAARV